MNPRFRPGTNEDIPAVKALVFGVLEEYGLTPDPASTDADLNDPEVSYGQRGGRFDLLELDENEPPLIGTVGLWPLDENRVELRKMYLLPAWRGRGYGRLMMDHALKEARRLGFQQMTLETASSLKGAIRLYETYGFRPWQPDHLAARCDQAMILDL